ncbi:MAG: hypothetical protein AAF696_23995 [Bacteroidota bacterium]
MVQKHKKYSAYLGLLLFFLFSQSRSFGQNQLFLEIGGFSKTYSINFSLQLLKDYDQQSFIRFGGAIEENRFIAPLGFIFIKGNRTHFWEASGGLTLWSEGYQFWDRDRSDLFLNINGGLAYRYQPFREMYYVSIGLFPFVSLDPSPNGVEASTGFRPGFSLGYQIR